MLGPCGPLVCWCGYPCRGVLNTPHWAPPSVANVPPRYVHRYVHSAPFGGPFGGAYAVAPRGFAAQGFAAQGFALGYGPPGLQPSRVRPIRALRPGWGAYAIRPYRGTCIRVPSGTRPNSPASADARPYTGTCIRVPSGTRPASLPRQGPSADAPTPRKPSAACFEPSEASETLKQLVWAFPRPRKP